MCEATKTCATVSTLTMKRNRKAVGSGNWHQSNHQKSNQRLTDTFHETANILHTMINRKIMRAKTLVSALFAMGITTITAMLPSETEAGTLVKFNWSDKNKRAQVDEEVIRRARALDGQLAVIMNTPLWPNGNRVLIQSLDDRDLTLAVKCTHLEKVEPIEINLIHAQHDRLLSDEYLNKEEEINDSNDYDLVMTVHPATQSSDWHVADFGNIFQSEFESPYYQIQISKNTS